MFWLRLIYSRLYGLLRKNRIEQEMEDELRFHLRMRTRENIERGMRPDEAEREARRRFGNVGHIKDLGRDIKGGGFMESVLQDLRFGTRMLMKSPGFTLIAVLTLALGIGANTTIFSVVNAVLLRPLPYPEPERLVMASLTNPAQGKSIDHLGMANFLAVRERNQSFEKVTAFSSGSFTFTGGESPEQVSGAWVSADFFATLRVAPARGRAYHAEDERPESARVVIISNSFWQQRLAGEPQVIGKTINLNFTPYAIIGVMPESFQFALTPDAELWPVRVIRPPSRPGPYFMRCIGRLKPGVTEQQAQADLSAIAAQVQQQFPVSTFNAMTTRPLMTSVVAMCVAGCR